MAGRFSISQDGGRPLSWIFKLEILTAYWPSLRRANMRHHDTLHADRSNRCRDGRFSIFEDGGSPPSWIWICYTPVWTIHAEFFVVFVSVQNLVGISAGISITC